MANNNIQQQIEARVQAFVREVSDLVRSSAMDAVAGALGGAAAGGGAPRRGRPVGSKNAAPAAAKSTGRRGKRGKRTSEEVDAMGVRIYDHVKKNPGANVEGMAKAFGLKSKDLTLPIAKLMATKKLKTTGQRRGTKYHVR